MPAQTSLSEFTLAALTTVPAELLGLSRSLGTVERGKIANLFITDGPLFEEDTKVRRVFVDGISHEIEVKGSQVNNVRERARVQLAQQALQVR